MPGDALTEALLLFLFRWMESRLLGEHFCHEHFDPINGQGIAYGRADTLVMFDFAVEIYAPLAHVFSALRQDYKATCAGRRLNGRKVHPPIGAALLFALERRYLSG